MLAFQFCSANQSPGIRCCRRLVVGVGLDRFIFRNGMRRDSAGLRTHRPDGDPQHRRTGRAGESRVTWWRRPAGSTTHLSLPVRRVCPATAAEGRGSAHRLHQRLINTARPAVHDPDRRAHRSPETNVAAHSGPRSDRAEQFPANTGRMRGTGYTSEGLVTLQGSRSAFRGAIHAADSWETSVSVEFLNSAPELRTWRRFTGHGADKYRCPAQKTGAEWRWPRPAERQRPPEITPDTAVWAPSATAAAAPTATPSSRHAARSPGRQAATPPRRQVARPCNSALLTPTPPASRMLSYCRRTIGGGRR